jgi:hypothetical protein
MLFSWVVAQHAYHTPLVAADLVLKIRDNNASSE